MLLNAVILISIMLMVMQGLFESTLLQIKMTTHFKQHRESIMAAKIALQKRIEALEKGNCDKNCEFIQFIPDAYFQYETEGVHYYRLNGEHGVTVAIRKSAYSIPEVYPNAFSNLLHERKQIPIIGDSPDNQGALIYFTMTSEDGAFSVIEAWQQRSREPLQWLFTIDNNTRLSVPALWHGRLIIDEPLHNKISVYDAYTGDKISEGETSLSHDLTEMPMCSLTPRVLVRKARERKRKVMVNRDFSVWSAELEMDYERLGKRADILVTPFHIR